MCPSTVVMSLDKKNTHKKNEIKELPAIMAIFFFFFVYLYFITDNRYIYTILYYNTAGKHYNYFAYIPAAIWTTQHRYHLSL